MTLTIDRPKSTDRTGGRTGYGYRVILWNCACHTFDDVAQALMQAIRCSLDRGMNIANTVHVSGKAVVYEGHLERCEAVAEVLQSFGLRVTLEQ